MTSRYYRLSLLWTPNYIPRVSAITRVDCTYNVSLDGFCQFLNVAFYFLVLTSSIGLCILCCQVILYSYLGVLNFVLIFQWLNGKEVMTHSGGHLPFEADVTSLLSYDKVNRITAAVNNTLTPSTLPPGEIKYLVGDR